MKRTIWPYTFGTDIRKIFVKFLHDIALIFYDDLEFKAMSLPRVAIGILTIVYIINWVFSRFFNSPYEMESFPMVYATAWGAYSVKTFSKAWQNKDMQGSISEESVGGDPSDEYQRGRHKQ